MKKFLLGAGAALASTLGFVGTAAAQSPIAVPEGLTASTTAFIGGQISDAGTVAVLVIVIGLPVAFWLARQVKGLFPSSRGR